MINSKTSIYALLGYPVEHSLSPIFWNAAFKDLNLNSLYVALPVEPENIMASLNGLKVSGFKGLNITKPHKKAAYMFCNLLHETAKETQIVNTIKFSSKDIIEGWNTDAVGFLNVLKKFKLPNTSILVFGDGASSKSIIWALKKYGVKIIHQVARKTTIESDELIDISDNKKIILKKLSWNYKNINNSIKESDIIINTTPLGWHEKDDIYGFSESLDVSKCFIDLNYNKKSKLLSCAKEKCGKTIDGRELLFEQGIEAFKVLTNYAPSAEIIRSSIFD